VSTRPWIVDDDLWALIEPLLPPWPQKSPGPRPVADRLCPQGILYVLHNDRSRRPGPPACHTGVRRQAAGVREPQADPVEWPVDVAPARPVTQLPTGPWAYEIKVDGHRTVL
jgi:hypothetical protein